MHSKTIKDFPNDISSFIHQAALDPHLGLDSLNQICDACKHFNFAGLCTNLIRLPAARERLGKNKITKLVAVIDFPFGNNPPSIKRSEAEWAAENGADELDVVPNFLKLHEGAIEDFAEELSTINSTGLPYRVILDTMKIPKEKLQIAIDACIDSGARGIQTGNGFGAATTYNHIKELTTLIRNRCSLKAAGGIKEINQVFALIDSGVSSIGTSMGATIIQQFRLSSKQQ